MKINIVIILLFILVMFSIGCSSADHEPLYGDPLYAWNGTAWVHITGSGVLAEVDPLWSLSPSFGITAGNIATWNGLVSSQWVTDANGIHYDLGNIGIDTPSDPSRLLYLFSHDGTSNDPVLQVHDNSASDSSAGILIDQAGAKTGDIYSLRVSNAATSGTAGIDKYGIYIASSSGWTGANSYNYGIYVDAPIGGTNNVTAHFGNATNYSEWDVNGFYTLHGSAGAWDDLRFPVSGIRLPSLGFISPIESTTIPPGITYAFEDKALPAQEEEITFIVQLPHSYKEGSDIYFHIHYVYPTSQLNTRALWGLEYDWQNDGGHFGTGTHTIYTYSDYATSANMTNKLASFTPIVGTGHDISSILVCRLFRDSADLTDNYTSEVNLLEVDVHYQIDSMGSREELEK